MFIMNIVTNEQYIDINCIHKKYVKERVSSLFSPGAILTLIITNPLVESEYFEFRIQRETKGVLLVVTYVWYVPVIIHP